MRDALRFERVSFADPSRTVALDQVDFTVGAGETVAIVGPSGSGKSTLAAILLRLRAPPPAVCRSTAGMPGSSPPRAGITPPPLSSRMRFSFTARCARTSSTAALRSPAISCQTAIATANLQDVVASLPNGLDTLVGERGSMVSGGQRQRIAIARAVIRNPSILILDEATSHLDAVSEQLVQQALVNAARGRTTIVIAHRLSTIREADKLVVLQQGRIVEEGTWESLESAGGVFQQLVRGFVT